MRQTILSVLNYDFEMMNQKHFVNTTFSSKYKKRKGDWPNVCMPLRPCSLDN